MIEQEGKSAGAGGHVLMHQGRQVTIAAGILEISAALDVAECGHDVFVLPGGTLIQVHSVDDNAIWFIPFSLDATTLLAQAKTAAERFARRAYGDGLYDAPAEELTMFQNDERLEGLLFGAGEALIEEALVPYRLQRVEIGILHRQVAGRSPQASESGEEAMMLDLKALARGLSLPLDYAFDLKLYEIEDGETYLYVARTPEEARAQYLAECEEWGTRDEVIEGDLRIRELPGAELLTIAGDDPEHGAPKKGVRTRNPIGEVTHVTATAAAWLGEVDLDYPPKRHFCSSVW